MNSEASLGRVDNKITEGALAANGGGLSMLWRVSVTLQKRQTLSLHGTHHNLTHISPYNKNRLRTRELNGRYEKKNVGNKKVYKHTTSRHSAFNGPS